MHDAFGEHFLDAAEGFARPLFVLDEGEVDVAVAGRQSIQVELR